MEEFAPTSSGPGFHALSRRQLIGTIVGLQLVLLLAALDQTIVGTAMPRIIAQLNGFDRYAWVTTAYLLTSTIAVPIFGKLSDLYGRKPFLLGGSIVFVLASALCGAAGDLPLPGDGMAQLIAFRALQGLAGGAATGIIFAVIGDIFPPAERGKYQGLFSAVWGLAAVFGPTLGGFITDNFSWRWVFYVNAPIGAIAIGTLVVAFPYFRPERAGGRRPTIDVLGVVTLVGCLVPLLLGLTWVTEYGWTSGRVLGLFAVAVASGAAFLAAEARAVEPILPLSLFRMPIVSLSSIALFVTGMGMFGSILFIPLFMQAVIGVSATQSGTLLTPMMLTLMAASVVSGQLVSRLGRYKPIAIVGSLVMTGGMLLLAQLGLDATRGQAVLAMVVVGVGLGLMMPLYTLIVQNAVPRSQLGVATAVTQFWRSIGGTVGAAIFGSLMLDRYRSGFLAGLPPQVNALSVEQRDPLVAAFSNPLQLAQVLPQLQARFAAAPGGPALLAALQTDVKQALVGSLNHVFVIGAAVVALSLVVNLLLPEVALKGRTREAAGDAEATLAGASPEGALAGHAEGQGAAD